MRTTVPTLAALLFSTLPLACVAPSDDDVDTDDAWTAEAELAAEVRPAIGKVLELDVLACRSAGVCDVSLENAGIPVRSGDRVTELRLLEQVKFDWWRRSGTLTREGSGFLVESAGYRLRLQPSTGDAFTVQVLAVPARAGDLATLTIRATARWTNNEVASPGPRMFDQLRLPRRELTTVWRKQFGREGDPILILNDKYKDSFQRPGVSLDTGVSLRIDDARLISVTAETYTMQSSITGPTARALFDALPAGARANVRRFAIAANEVGDRVGRVACRIGDGPATCTAVVVVQKKAL